MNTKVILITGALTGITGVSIAVDGGKLAS